MKEEFRDYLFSHHILVDDEKEPITMDIAFNTIMALASMFGIRIRGCSARYASESMIHDAARNLGRYVPEPFYRGFPNTVRNMTTEQLVYDQLYHYTQTYGLGWFDESGHSVFEDIRMATDAAYDKIASEHFEPKDFKILREAEAKEELIKLLNGLTKSTRPLNPDQQVIIWHAYQEYGPVFIDKDGFASKRTAAFFICNTKDMTFAKGMHLADTIKVLEYIQYDKYDSENLNKLNLKNQDRKLITKLLDHFFEKGITLRDIRECSEKKKIWQGLLHHIHYKPKTNKAKDFVEEIREEKNCSIMSEFEYSMSRGNVIEAAKHLAKFKGQSALVRNLNYILSRCKTEKEIVEVLSCLE